MSWDHNTARDLKKWSDAAITDDLIAGRGRVTRAVACECWERLYDLRETLRAEWTLPEEDWGYLTDWLLATLIARENVLLLGPPGVAKSEIATRTFQLIGLRNPKIDPKPLPPDLDYPWWKKRDGEERQSAKYFHYQLSRFTQIEELFGPVEIALLRRGVLVRINFAMLTGGGVRGAFIDEIFKASGALLNSLLMLFNERTYFNWGGIIPSDLTCIIAASNDMPGAFSDRGIAAGSMEDFGTLYALLDRLPIRLDVPLPSGTNESAVGGGVNPNDSSLGKAARQAITRESQKFATKYGFSKKPAMSEDEFLDEQQASCVNDLLALGRAMLVDQAIRPPDPQDDALFVGDSAHWFYNKFLRIGASLQLGATNLRNDSRISWTISPRKLKALFKVARAYALITAKNLNRNGTAGIECSASALRVYRHIWDTLGACDALERAVETECNAP